MFKTLIASSTFAATAVAATVALAANPMVGGAEMYPEKNIVENAVNSMEHTTLVAAVKQADLVETLAGDGPFTVFAPTNAAFDKLPEETVEALMTDPYKPALTEILTCHVVGEQALAVGIEQMIDNGDGATILRTLGGCELVARMSDDEITLTDERGQTINVTLADVVQSNGVIHVVDTVILPAVD